MMLSIPHDDPPPPPSRPASPSAMPGVAFRAAGSPGASRPEGRPARGADISDAELVRRVIEGDADAYRWIVERYQARVYTTIFRIVRRAEDAEDLAQDTFVRAFQNLVRYDPERPFATWLLTIATRLTFNALRQKEPRALSLDEPMETGESSEPFTLRDVVASPGERPDEAASTEELRARIEDAAERLPSSMRAVFALRYQQDLPLSEIGKITGLSLAAVKVALHRARKFLRDWIQP